MKHEKIFTSGLSQQVKENIDDSTIKTKKGNNLEMINHSQKQLFSILLCKLSRKPILNRLFLDFLLCLFV